VRAEAAQANATIGATDPGTVIDHGDATGDTTEKSAVDEPAAAG
jgi:hypothetical protein